MSSSVVSIKNLDLGELCFGFGRLLAALTLAIGAGTASAASEAEKLVPMSFDPKHAYATYSVDELATAVEHYEVTKENFIGRKVKVLASYDVEDNATLSWINPHAFNRALNPGVYPVPPSGSASSPPVPLGGCKVEICTRMEMMFHLHNFFDPLVMNLRDPYIAVYFKKDKDFSDFVGNAKQLCDFGFVHRCYLWTRGTLRFAQVELKAAGGTISRGLFYVDADEYRLYKSAENSQWLAVKQGVGFAIDALPTVAKVLGSSSAP